MVTLSQAQKIEQFRVLYLALLNKHIDKYPERNTLKVRSDPSAASYLMMQSIEDNTFRVSNVVLRGVCQTLSIEFTINSIRKHLDYAHSLPKHDKRERKYERAA